MKVKPFDQFMKCEACSAALLRLPEHVIFTKYIWLDPVDVNQTQIYLLGELRLNILDLNFYHSEYIKYV